MKKANNQGFSLVELIIVIAIMAVLVGVLAPQFIKICRKF
jgi:type IV pilus assembly protein PilA